MHSHPHNFFCYDRNCQMITHQEIQKIYEAKAGRIDLFDRLLMEKKQSQWADAESSAKIEQTEMQSQHPELNRTEEKRQHHGYHGCKCSKIGCLKLYCQCFANGRKCNGNCVCSCCRNRPGNQQEIYQAKMLANLRHPNHFQGIPALTPTRKCTCKKSMCRKKYCECYSSGLECTEFCECKDCQNGHPHSHNGQSAPLSHMMEAEISCIA